MRLPWRHQKLPMMCLSKDNLRGLPPNKRVLPHQVPPLSANFWGLSTQTPEPPRAASLFPVAYLSS